MRVATGCALTHIDERPRVQYGYERTPNVEAVGNQPCRSCAVITGQFHHWGCGVARCSHCGAHEHAGPCPAGC